MHRDLPLHPPPARGHTNTHTPTCRPLPAGHPGPDAARAQQRHHPGVGPVPVGGPRPVAAHHGAQRRRQDQHPAVRCCWAMLRLLFPAAPARPASCSALPWGRLHPRLAAHCRLLPPPALLLTAFYRQAGGGAWAVPESSCRACCLAAGGAAVKAGPRDACPSASSICPARCPAPAGRWRGCGTAAAGTSCGTASPWGGARGRCAVLRCAAPPARARMHLTCTHAWPAHTGSTSLCSPAASPPLRGSRPTRLAH